MTISIRSSHISHYVIHSLRISIAISAICVACFVIKVIDGRRACSQRTIQSTEISLPHSLIWLYLAHHHRKWSHPVCVCGRVLRKMFANKIPSNGIRCGECRAASKNLIFKVAQPLPLAMTLYGIRQSIRRRSQWGRAWGIARWFFESRCDCQRPLHRAAVAGKIAETWKKK